MILGMYLARRFLAAFLRVLLAVLLIIVIADGFEHARRYGDEGAGLAEVAAMTLLNAPVLAYDLLPIMVLIAAVAHFTGLARSSELVVTRASGVSALRVVLVPVLAAAAVGVLAVVVGHPITAVSASKHLDMTEAYQASGRMSVDETGVWLRQTDRDGQTVIHAARAAPTGDSLTAVTFHRYDADSALVARLRANIARLGDGAWTLYNGKSWPLGPEVLNPEASATRFITRSVPTEITQDQILEGFAPPGLVGFWQLPAFIEQLEASGFTAQRHRTYWQAQLALPLLTGAMVMVGAAFTMRHARLGRTGLMILWAVLSGFALYVFAGVARTLGSAGEVPIPLAVWAPPAAALMLGLARVLAQEDG